MAERRMEPIGGALVASTAVVEGDVTLHDRVSVWWNAVLRGDDAALVVGEETNLQDLVMVHPDPGAPMTVGSGVTVGHHAVLHGIFVGDRALIGIGAILLSGSVIGEGAIVAAGSLVREGQEVPPGVLVAGLPARVIRDVKPKELEGPKYRSEKYWAEARKRARVS